MNSICYRVLPVVLGLFVLASSTSGIAATDATDGETSSALGTSPSDVLLSMGVSLINAIVGKEVTSALFPSQSIDYDRINQMVVGADIDQTVMEQKGTIAGIVQTMHDLDTRRLNGEDKLTLYSKIDDQWPGLNNSMAILTQPEIGTKGLGAFVIGVQAKAGMFGELIALDPTRAQENGAVLADNLRVQSRYIKESKLALVTAAMSDRVRQVQCTSPSPPSLTYPFIVTDGGNRVGQYQDLMSCNRAAVQYVNSLISGVMASDRVQNLSFMDGVVANLHQVHAAVYKKDSFITVTKATYGGADITGAVGGTCNMLTGCTYPINTIVVGDPAPMGVKYVQINYTCSGASTPKVFQGLDWNSPVTAQLSCGPLP